MGKRRNETPEEYELRQARFEAEQRDARMNEPLTRGAVLEAIDLALFKLGDEGDSDHVNILKLLRESFE